MVFHQEPKSQYMSNTIKHQNTDILWINIRQHFIKTQNTFYTWAKHSTGQEEKYPEDQGSGAPVWPLASDRWQLASGPNVGPGLRVSGLFLFCLVESKNIYFNIKLTLAFSGTESIT